MNLRQKCKKLKKENELLQKYIPGHPSPMIHVDHHQIVTLAARKELDPEYETLDYYRNLMESDLLEDIANGVRPHIKIIEYRDMVTGRKVIEGRAQVIKPDTRRIL